MEKLLSVLLVVKDPLPERVLAKPVGMELLSWWVQGSLRVLTRQAPKGTFPSWYSVGVWQLVCFLNKRAITADDGVDYLHSWIFFSQYLFFQLLFQLIFHREASDSPCLAPAYSVQDKNIKVMLKEGISSENDTRNSLWVPYMGSISVSYFRCCSGIDHSCCTGILHFLLR